MSKKAASTEGKETKRVSSTFNKNQLFYLDHLAKMQGLALTTYVTNLAVAEIKTAIADGRLPVNLPSLENRHLVMCKFIRYFILMTAETGIAEEDKLTESDLAHVASSAGVDVETLKSAFFE